jgi:hypothetical protein
LDNDNIPKLDALLTSEDETIFVWTMSARAAEWLSANYRACCGSPGSCGCGPDGERQIWEIGTKRETWLSEGHALELSDSARAAGLNVDFLYAGDRSEVLTFDASRLG